MGLELGKRWRDLTVLYTDADCLSSKIDEFQVLISTLKSQVIVITKSLPENCQQSDVYFQLVCDYNLIVNSNYKRGIFIYVYTSMKPMEVNDPISSSISECLVVNVKVTWVHKCFQRCSHVS